MKPNMTCTSHSISTIQYTLKCHVLWMTWVGLHTKCWQSTDKISGVWHLTKHKSIQWGSSSEAPFIVITQIPLLSSFRVVILESRSLQPPLGPLGQFRLSPSGSPVQAASVQGEMDDWGWRWYLCPWWVATLLRLLDEGAAAGHALCPLSPTGCEHTVLSGQ